MMHKKNFVGAIKVDGKVLRESSDRVELPFGSEYSVLLKNLDTVRMQAQISIDGQDASGWLVVDPGASVDVERFYRQNRDRGNRFKFIERTDRIEEHRGIGAEDGLVRIEFKREKVYEVPKIVEHHTYHHYRPYYGPITWQVPYSYPYSYISQSGGQQGALTSQAGVFNSSSSTTNTTGKRSGVGGQSVLAMNTMVASAQNEAGITVDGSISQQRFISVAGFECEASEVIVLHLVGNKQQTPVRIAKTVDQKPTCSTCGKKNKANSKFCIECGTSLQKV